MSSRKLIPAAEYVRMSTEDQKYSIPNQQAVIHQYAALHGFFVCRTYADPGKSGVLIRHREGLSKLLQDVVAGNVKYKAVLVYDVSRWGRFQNPDESAHYDFICANAGIPVHYCAEQFSNDGSMQASLMKAIKRTMAGEFSRELGVKVFDGLKRLVLQGFHAGAIPAYGLGRMMVSPSGRRKGILKNGEQKNLKTDKVVLVHGPRREVQCVRRIFSMAASERRNCPQIAAELNANGILYRNGKTWDCDRVLRVLRDPQYTGLNVWARRAQKMYGPSIQRPRASWVTSPARFRPIIDQATFDAAQRTLAASKVCPDTSAHMLAGLARLLARKGQLSSDIIDKSRTIRSASTYVRRFGSLLNAYELIGFTPAAGRLDASVHSRRAKRLHADVLRNIRELFPEHVRIVSSKKEKRSIEVDRAFRVSVLLCGKRCRPLLSGECPWLLRILPRERLDIALICTLDSTWKKILRYYLVPPLGDSVTPIQSLRKGDPLLTIGAAELIDLREFCQTVRNVAASVPMTADLRNGWDEKNLEA